MESVRLIPMELVHRLFGEAWEYRRRRNRRIAAGSLGLIALVVVAGLIVGRFGNTPPTQQFRGADRGFATSSALAGGEVLQIVGPSIVGFHVTVEVKRPAKSI